MSFTIYPRWILKDFYLTLSQHLSGCRTSYKIFKKLTSPNTQTRHLICSYFRIYRSIQCATLIRICTSNYQWKISSLTADEFPSKRYHHSIMKKIRASLFHKVNLVGQTLKVPTICKEQDKSTYLCKLAVHYK